MPAETRSPVEAFDALSGRVAAMHADLRVAMVQKVPDYALTLGEITKTLGEVKETLAEVKGDTASLRRRLFELARSLGEAKLPRELSATAREIQAATRGLREATGTAIAQQDVRRWAGGTGVVGFVVGVALSFIIAFLLVPQAGRRAATAVLEEEPWTTGQMLMRQADPATFQRMVQLYRACPKNSSTKHCVAALSAVP